MPSVIAILFAEFVLSMEFGVMENISALKWLAERDDGIGNLPWEDQREAMEFSMLWTYFEARFFQTRASPKAIRDFATALDESGCIQIDVLSESLEYLCDRYVRDGKFTEYFVGLNLRENDNVPLIKNVLLGIETSPRALLIFCLAIVLRYRNNLFHGVKWSYALKGQRGNFKVANQILMSVAEMAMKSRPLWEWNKD